MFVQLDSLHANGRVQFLGSSITASSECEGRDGVSVAKGWESPRGKVEAETVANMVEVGCHGVGHPLGGFGPYPVALMVSQSAPGCNRDLLLSTRFVYHPSSNYTLVDGNRCGPGRCIAALVTPPIGKKNSAKGQEAEWPYLEYHEALCYPLILLVTLDIRVGSRYFAPGLTNPGQLHPAVVLGSEPEHSRQMVAAGRLPGAARRLTLERRAHASDQPLPAF